MNTKRWGLLKGSNFGNGSDFIKVVNNVRYRVGLKVAILKKVVISLK